MAPRPRSRPVAAAALALLLLAGGGAAAGCGDDEGAEPSGTVTAPRRDADRRPARRLPPARLPRGWRRVVNRRAGFSFGLPPGWRVRGARGATVLRAPDGGLSAAVSADRTPDSANIALRDYVRRAVGSLPGYRGLRLGPATRVVDLRLPAWSASARGRFARTGVRQSIVGFALRPRGGATFTLLFFRTARAARGRHAVAIRGIVRTLRPRRPRAQSAGRSG